MTAFTVNALTGVFTGNIDGMRLYGDRPLGDITKHNVSYKAPRSVDIIAVNPETGAPISQETLYKQAFRYASTITRAQSWRAPDPASGGDTSVVPVVETVDPPTPSRRRARRRARREDTTQEAFQQWGSEFLTTKQDEDRDLIVVKMWLSDGMKTSWDDIRGYSPTVKAYFQQMESLVLIGGVIYRQKESLGGESVYVSCCYPSPYDKNSWT